jgi:hypothetical protein
MSIDEIYKSPKDVESDRMTARFLVLGYGVHVARFYGVEGFWMEFGVNTGETINFIARRERVNTIYGFDSFAGLPEDWIEGYPKGCFNTNGRKPKVENNVELVEGLFQKSLIPFMEEFTKVDKGEAPVSFLHIDSDLYSSAKFVLETLKNRIVRGTVICFDEMINFPNYQEHEFRAFNEFLEETGKKAFPLCHNNYEQVAFQIN